MATPQAPAKQATPKPPAKFKVMAIAEGYYNDKFRRVGDVFFIDGTLPRPDQIKRKNGPDRDPTLPILFSDKWMMPAGPEAQVHITSSNEAIRRANAQIAAARAVDRGASAVDEDPLGAEE